MIAMRLSGGIPGGVALVLLLLTGLEAAGAGRRPGQVWRRGAEHQDVSPPVLLLPPKPFVFKRKPKAFRLKHIPRVQRPPVEDGARQLAPMATEAMPAPEVSFDGVGHTFEGPGGTFFVNSSPPDTVGDVGPAHYVQVVNSGLAIFDKTGKPLYGPVATHTLWSGFGGACEQNNDGDGIVLYDPLADRWFITQFSVSSLPFFFQCVAVSVSGDPLGQYYRYAFAYDDYPDYGKFGVWPDGYYAAFNSFGVPPDYMEYQGGDICAYDRGRMLRGEPATQQCVRLGATVGGMLTADLDGARLPPTGSPNYVATFDFDTASNTHELWLWGFHVDWKDMANTRLVRYPDLPVAPLTIPCAETHCGYVAQAGSATLLDSMGDRLMFRLAYRNQGTHEALVMNHTVAVEGGGTGIRWYEVRRTSGEPFLFQEGTYAPPDGAFRWMASMAMDQAGNIAVGYSRSSKDSHPNIQLAGRLASDEPNQLLQGETELVSGGGSQDGVHRWGDYSAMSVDPTDDCTFWFTGEYLKTTGTFNWSSRVGAFKFPNCPYRPANDFALSISSGSTVVSKERPARFTVNTTLVGGTAEDVQLTVEGLPTGLSATFEPPVVEAGGSTTLTLSASTSAERAYLVPFNVVGTSASVSRVVLARFDVVRDPNDFSLVLEPSTRAVPSGKNASLDVVTARTSGISEPVTLEVSGLPTGVSGAFIPAVVQAGERATLTLTATADAPGARATFTVTGRSPSALHSETGLVLVPNDFSMTLTQTLVRSPAGEEALFQVDTRVTSGSGEEVRLSVSGLPPTVRATFEPELVISGQSARLKLFSEQPSETDMAFTVQGTSAQGQRSMTGQVAFTPPPTPQPPDAGSPSVSVPEPTGCGCASEGGGTSATVPLLLLAALGAAIRRQPRPSPGG